MRKTKFFDSEVGTAADADLVFKIGLEGQENTFYTVLKAIIGYRDFSIHTITGSVRVLASLDGTNFADQLALAEEPDIAADAVAGQAGDLVAVTSTGKIAHFSGDYRALKFQQVGSTPAQIKLLCAADE